jgi:hypothetical protein
MPTKVRGRCRVSRWPGFACRWQPDKRMSLPLGCRRRHSLSPDVLMEDGCTSWVCHAREFPTVRRSAKQAHRAERTAHRALPSGYSIREFYNHPQGRYWYVVAALEVIPTKKRRSNRI